MSDPIPRAEIPEQGDRHRVPDSAPEHGSHLDAGTGATLVAAGPWEPGDRSSYARRPVLALRHHHPHDPYAVWWEVYADDRDEPVFSYYSGGYHSSLEGAYSDWLERKRHVLERREEVSS